MGGGVTTPRLSILIPTRDRLDFLRESLNSARSQTLDDLEILVSDDGSSDATVDYVRRIGAEDQRVRLLTGNPTPGAFANISYLVGQASGAAIAVLGDDDTLLPTFGERLTRALDDADAVVAYGLFEVISKDGHSQPRKTAMLRRYHHFTDTPPGIVTDAPRAAMWGQMWLGSCVYRADVVRELGFDGTVGSAADWDLAIRVTSRGRAVFVAEPLWRYRDHQGTISRVAWFPAISSAIAVLERHNSLSTGAERVRVKRLQDLLLLQAWKSVPVDADLARASIRRYDHLIGSRWAPRRLLALSLLSVPPAYRAGLHSRLVHAVEAVRRLSR